MDTFYSGFCFFLNVLYFVFLKVQVLNFKTFLVNYLLNVLCKVHLLNSDLNIKEGNESDLNICIKPTHDRFYQQKQNTKHSNTQEELKRNCPLTPHRFRFTMMMVMMMMTMMVVMMMTMMTMMIMLHSSNVTVRLTPHRLANFNSPASATH